MKNKIATIMICTLCLIIFPSRLGAEETVNSLKSDVERANENIKSNQEKIDKKEEEIATLTEKINKAESDLDKVKTNVADNEQEIKKLNKEIKSKEDQIKQLKKELAKRVEQTENLLILLQRNHNVNMAVELLYSGEGSLMEKISTMHSLNRLSEKTMEEVEKTMQIQTKLSTEKESLEAQKVEVKNEQESLKKQGSELIEKSTKQEETKMKVLDEIASLKGQTYEEQQKMLKKADLMATYKAAGCSGDDVYGTDCAVPIKVNTGDIKASDINTKGGSYVKKLKSNYYANWVINKESGWNPTAVNATSGAYGICQSLPGTKMAAAGSDWKTNIETQAKWCDAYANSRYGGWEGAYDHHQIYNWF